MKKNVQQTELTKQKLQNAFWDIHSEKYIEKITVREIAERAGVNRSTFYAYYKDAYDILEQSEDDIINALMSEHHWRSGDLLDTAKYKEDLKSIGMFLQKHQKPLSILIGEKGDPRFSKRLWNSAWHDLRENLGNLTNRPDDPMLDYIVEYIDNINAGTAKVKITGKGSYSGIVYKPFTITSTTTPAKQFKYIKTSNDIAVELPTSLVSGIKDMEKIQIIVAYYDKETIAFLRMQKKTVRALTGDIIESFKLENEGEYAKVYVWNGDVSEAIPAYTYLTVNN